MNEIIDGLFLGGVDSATDLEELKKNDIKHVISLVEEERFSPIGVEWINHTLLLVFDDDYQDLMQYFPRCNKLINDALEKGEKVLVHCIAGISRSSTIVIAYLMKAKGMTRQEATQFVKSKRKKVNPRIHFTKQLDVYELMGYEVRDGYYNNLVKSGSSVSHVVC